MRVPIRWLKDFVDFSYSVQELAERLTMVGLEVEEILTPFSYLKDVFIGQIKEIAPHPNADKLRICRVSLGQSEIKVVCGAPNIKEGMFVPLALEGCELPSGIKVKKARIREIESPGMLCSQKELGLGEDHSGIWSLSSELPLGMPLNKALGLDDVVLEVSITPNRGDCLSILGIAREVAALTGGGIRLPQVEISEIDGDIKQEFKVAIEAPDHCYRYIGRLIKDITIVPSPWWMQARLLLSGLRPINNVVDITNYVMLEYGQPLHAFDAEKIAQKHVIVRLARQGEEICTLDGKRHKLSQDDLLICDAKTPIALAGIMGGYESEITPQTKDVFLESAYFNPITIRKTAKRLGISTESSYRFEREVDPEGTYNAVQRATHLIQTLAQGKVVSGMIDNYPRPYCPKKIALRLPRINQILGVKLEKEVVKGILSNLQIEIREREDTLEVTPPSYRHDLEREIDFIEEIARIYGYDKIEPSFPLVPLKGKQVPSHQKWREQIKDFMVGLGWHEIITYAFIDPKSLDKLLLPQGHEMRRVVRLLNPLTADRSVMRSSLIPGLLDACVYNQHQQINHLRLFELGKVFLDRGEELPEERYKIGGILSGYHYDPSWHFNPLGAADFFDVKGHLEGLFRLIGIRNFSCVPCNDIPYLNPTKAAYILQGNLKIGYVGELQAEVQAHWDLKSPAYVFELDITELLRCIPKQRQFESLPKFPFTFRDASFIVPLRCTAQAIKDFVSSLKVPFLEELEVIDVYQGNEVPEGTRSLTYRFIYRAPDRTLKDKEVEKIHRNIVNKIVKKFQIKVR